MDEPRVPPDPAVGPLLFLGAVANVPGLDQLQL